MSDRYRTLFQHARDGVWLTDREGRLSDVNPALLEMVGYDREDLLEREERILFADAEAWRSVQERLARDGSVRDEEMRLLRRDGREVVCLLRAVADRDGDGAVAGCQAIVHDITYHKHTEERRLHERLHDTLTHLPNRTSFLERVSRLLERVAFRPSYRFSVLFVDLDRFKRVNASLTHQAGDDLLVLVAERLTELVRPEDVVGRMGGDEFAVLLLDVSGVADAEAVAARIQEGLERPFEVLGSDVYVSASIGIALGDAAYENADEVVGDAHTAMHVAKAEGAGGRAVFDGSMRDRAAALLATETALRRALERNEFLLHYQPLISMVSGRLLGFEALVRWMHPTRGLLPPAEFLSVAEESGLIVPLGEWVLREACRTTAAWRAERPGDDAPVVAVNLSGRQLVIPDLAEQVGAILEEHGLPGSALRLEITESVFLKRSDALLRTLEALAALGVTLCLDDFGTVYSTLAYLRDLPVHTLKIDRSFVHQLRVVGGSQMVETILSLARQLGLRAVAEGVETEAQMEDLVRLGCDDAQGFLFSKPVDAERARAMLGGEVARSG